MTDKINYTIFNNKVKNYIKHYLITFKNIQLDQSYKDMLKESELLEQQIEKFVVENPHRFIELLNKKNYEKEVITLKRGDLFTNQRFEQSDDYIKLLKKYSEVNTDKIKNNYAYICQIIETIIKTIDNTADKKNIFVTGELNTSLKNMLVKKSFTIEQHGDILQQINNFLLTNKTNEKRDLAALYYSNSSDFETKYNKIMENEIGNIGDLPKKLYVNSFTKHITNNILLFEESYILELLDIFYEIALDNIIVSSIDELTALCNYRPNIIFYEFLNIEIITFYNDLLNVLDVEYSEFFCKEN